MMILPRFTFPAEARAKRFARLVRIPSEIRGGSDSEELRRMGLAISRLKVPSKEKLEHELDVVRQVGIPLLVVTGGWSPAFEAAADRVAATSGGRQSRVPPSTIFLIWSRTNSIRCLELLAPAEN